MVQCNASMDGNYQEGEEENSSPPFKEIVQ